MNIVMNIFIFNVIYNYMKRYKLVKKIIQRGGVHLIEVDGTVVYEDKEVNMLQRITDDMPITHNGIFRGKFYDSSNGQKIPKQGTFYYNIYNIYKKPEQYPFFLGGLLSLEYQPNNCVYQGSFNTSGGRQTDNLENTDLGLFYFNNGICLITQWDQNLPRGARGTSITFPKPGFDHFRSSTVLTDEQIASIKKNGKAISMGNPTKEENLFKIMYDYGARIHNITDLKGVLEELEYTMTF
jgi:hypothetical protein